MIPVKVQCECGQRYAFDVEPANGRMPYTVACPTCGQDGTSAANGIIISQLPPPVPPPVNLANNPTLHLAGHVPMPPEQNGAPAPGRSNYLRSQQLGLVDHEQAKHEARAKTMWGDSAEKVTSYLMIQGFSHQEASELVQVLSAERKVAVRANGIKKMVIGSGLMCVPVVAFFYFIHIRFMPIKVMGMAIAVGLWGAWMFINGLIKVVVPKMESGDVAEN
jgi:hypothetical protein